MSAATRVAVVGAGLGGLAAAIALLRKGFDVTVYEHASVLSEVGAGVQLAPNAIKVLRALRLEDEVLAHAFEPNRHVLRNWKRGRLLFATALKGVFHEKFGAGYYQIHRADLHRILADALPPERIKLNHKCIGLRDTGPAVELTFENGAAIESDAVIGADGIHSAVRTSLFGPEAPRFTGNTCWRGLVPIEALPRGLVEPDVTVWLGPHGHVVHYYVRGGKFVNYVASYEADDWRSESWVTEGNRNDLLKAYAGWSPRLLELFHKTDKCYRWALYDRDPLPQWTKGRATLVGDSAHPMLPYLAQGACMAIEDAYVLSNVLSEHGGDVNAAFAVYENIRRPRTARVQLNARSRAKTNHLASPVARFSRDLGYTLKRIFKPGGTSYGAEWIYGYDATQANAATS